MRNQVHPHSQMLDSLLSTILNQTLICNCERKTRFCRLFFTTNEPTIYHSLYHILNLLTPHMNWLFIIYDRDFSTAADEIFLWLLQILCNDSSIFSAWSFMVTDNKIWEPESVIMNGSIINVDLQCMPLADVEELLRLINESEHPILQVFRSKSIGSLAEICNGRRNHDVSQIGNKHQRSMDWRFVMRYLAINVDYTEAIWKKPWS
ncbi:hypothetical protein ES288_D04G214100v1 [Gossypium darwinii]|uniref:Uncharacterized protein n=1 Tax=Gossypium darwinii TaxID=34276 RepID=A0A5D2D031_GOSDA|nr:hypothetical protein GOBAR_DD30346 [Gossypium barbadense]TYG74824.1 hypothetical protein ES288_D04G214100v1 [Gossypium darwinii]